jgi:protein-tyrosine phosphatase
MSSASSEAKSPTGRNISAPFQPPAGSQSPFPGASASASPTASGDVDYRNHNFKPLQPLAELTKEVYMGPTPESNWVIPNVLLVGAFPASQDDDETFLLISEILKLGINKFVCLQQEYRETGVTEAMWRGGHGLRPYFEDVKKIVANKSKFDAFRGVKICNSSELSFVHFPIRDCGITDDSAVLKLCRQLVKAISEGAVLYLHCWGGHGRTGTVVCIMLYLMYQLNAQEAMNRCQIVHDMRQYPVEVGSPQTQSQRDQVTRVINQLKEEMEGIGQSRSTGDGNGGIVQSGDKMNIFLSDNKNVSLDTPVSIFLSPVSMGIGGAPELMRCATEVLTEVLDSDASIGGGIDLTAVDGNMVTGSSNQDEELLATVFTRTNANGEI